MLPNGTEPLEEVKGRLELAGDAGDEEAVVVRGGNRVGYKRVG